MKQHIEGEDRTQVALLPECLDDYVLQDNPVRVIEVFVDQLDLRQMGFDGAAPAVTGRPAYHPAVLLKIYIYGYLNRIQSSRRLEREAQRNVELMWLTGRLMPDFKTIANLLRTIVIQLQTPAAFLHKLDRPLPHNSASPLSTRQRLARFGPNGSVVPLADTPPSLQAGLYRSFTASPCQCGFEVF